LDRVACKSEELRRGWGMGRWSGKGKREVNKYNPIYGMKNISPSSEFSSLIAYAYINTSSRLDQEISSSLQAGKRAERKTRYC
jgi:hypothetical protein